MSRGTLKLLLSVFIGACAPVTARAGDAPALAQHLRDTGLYADGSASQLREGVLPFSPQYPLWSDGAVKRRWIYLPPGTSIDATKPDAWDFPRGTKLWKEFRHGRALETRFMERGADGEWRFASYVWSADGADAVLAPVAGIREMPAREAPGARYTIPAQDDCRACHEGAPVPVLGFSALQLSPDRDPLAPHAESSAVAVDLRSLVARGLLRNLSPELLANPPRIEAANPDERAALGYLHGNCGNCHNDEGPLAVLEMTLAQRVGAQGTINDAVLRSVVDVQSQFRGAGGIARVAPGHPGASVIALRMRSREPMQQMPPLGTTAVDTVAMALIARWIESLPVQ
jgi:hypothetical protein